MSAILPTWNCQMRGIAGVAMVRDSSWFALMTCAAMLMNVSTVMGMKYARYAKGNDMTTTPASSASGADAMLTAEQLERYQKMLHFNRFGHSSAKAIAKGLCEELDMDMSTIGDTVARMAMRSVRCHPTSQESNDLEVNALIEKIVEAQDDGGEGLPWSQDEIDLLIRALQSQRTRPDAVAITQREFIDGYCSRSGVTLAWFNENYVALPCDCGEQGCNGWAAIHNTPEMVDMHNSLYSPAQATQQAGAGDAVACAHVYVRLPQVADGMVCHKCGEQLCPVCGTANPHWVPFNTGVLIKGNRCIPHSWFHARVGDTKRDDELSADEKAFGEWCPLYLAPADAAEAGRAAERKGMERAAEVANQFNDPERVQNIVDAIRAAAKLPDAREEDVMAERWKVIETLWTDAGVKLDFNAQGWPTLFCDCAESAAISRTGESPEEIIDKLAAEFRAAAPEKGASDV